MQDLARALFWLMPGDVPLGPFDESQIKSKLRTSEITLSTKACRVGADHWAAISDFPMFVEEFGVVADSVGCVDSDKSAQVEAKHVQSDQCAPKESPPSATNSAETKELVVGLAVIGVIAVAVLGLIWWWLTPLAPREVVERFNASTTLAEGKSYTTLNLHPALKALEPYLHDPSDPDDQDEITYDIQAPPEIGGHFVGYRGQFRDPSTKQMFQVDGFYHLIDVDGWKIEDCYFTAFNREELAEPFSMARNYRLILENTSPTRSPRPAGTAVKSWFQTPENQSAIARSSTMAVGRWIGKGGGKALAAVAFAVLAGIGGALFKGRKS